MTGKFLSGALVALAAVGMIVPQPVLAAAPVHKAAATDVRLNDSGQLVGQAVNATGANLSGTKVELRKNGIVAMTVETNDKGQFAMNSVAPGTYQLAVGPQVADVRVWNAATAPPTALPKALLLAGDPAVRGQYGPAECPPGGGGYFGGLDFITLATVGTATTAAIISGVTLSKVNDLEDAVNNASP